MRKSGFTLAEVLITLAVIGVVAALTVPILMVSYQKQQMLTALKKNYSVLNTAIQMAEQDFGPMETWSVYNNNGGLSGPDFANKYFKPYLNTLPSDREKDKYDSYYLDGKRHGTFYTDIALLDGTTICMGIITGGALGDGIIMSIDLNGNKKPNTYGKDIYRFIYVGNDCKVELDSNGLCIGYKPGAFQADRQYSTDFNINNLCSKTTGMSCAARIIRDNWQIKYDW